MRVLASLILLLLLYSSTAIAEISDEDYTSRYFGTRALLQSDTQLYNPDEMGYWTEILPEQLTYNNDYLAGVVNAGRISRGESMLLDPNEYLVSPGGENFMGSYYEYDISFTGMRPSEVEMIFSTLGGLEKIAPGARLEFAPLKTRDYYYYSQEPDYTVTVNVGEQSLDISLDMESSVIHEQLVELFRSVYDTDLNVDLYYIQQISSYRRGVDVSLTVTLLEAGESMADDQ